MRIKIVLLLLLAAMFVVPATTTVDAYTTHAPIEITSDADFVTQGWFGNGTLESPYIIEGLSIENEMVTCIHVESTSVYFVIRNCVLSTNNVGEAAIRLRYVENAILENNTCYGDANQLISVYFSDNITIVDNSCFGVGTVRAWHGMIIAQCGNVVISNNSVYNVDLYGIGLSAVYDCEIAFNEIYDCGSRGLYTYDSSYNNTLEWNFLNNTVANAINVAGPSNVYQYNYWSEYVGVDENGDGFGDVPYNNSGVIDNNPLMSWPYVIIDNSAPIIIPAIDITYEVGETGNTIWWDVLEHYPSSYNITRNGTLVASAGGYGSTISISVDGLEVGVYNYTLIATDMYTHSATDSVIVNVTEAIVIITTTTTTTTDTTTTETTTTIESTSTTTEPITTEPENTTLRDVSIGIAIGGFVTVTGAFVFKKVTGKKEGEK